MAVLTPFREMANDALRSHGVIAPRASNANKPTSRMSELLDECGASREECAVQIANMIRNAETEAGKQKAIDTALKLHGELNDKHTDNAINVTIIGLDTKIAQIFVPRS